MIDRSPRTEFRSNEVGRRPAAAQAVPKRVGLIVGRRRRVGLLAERRCSAPPPARAGNKRHYG
jgi:hypothetical protein